jgi:hypothetical protein
MSNNDKSASERVSGFFLTFKLYLKASSMFFSQTFLTPLNVHITGITKLTLLDLNTDKKLLKNTSHH